jgi:hypothetical protein
MPAAGALIEVSAERRRATGFDGGQHLPVLRGQPPLAFGENPSRDAEEIGHLERRPVHLFFPAAPAIARRRR